MCVSILKKSISLIVSKLDMGESVWYQQDGCLHWILSGNYIMNAMRRVNPDVGQKLAYFLATGNLVSKTGLDLQQVCFVVSDENNGHLQVNFYRSAVTQSSLKSSISTVTFPTSDVSIVVLSLLN